MNKSWIAVMMAATMSLTAVGADSRAVEISGPWVRALPPGQANTAAYLTISNKGPDAVTIIGATTVIANAVEIHTTRTVDGYRRMERLQQLVLAAGQALALAPGGTHLMLLGLERMPAPGEMVPLCLQLAGGEQVCSTAQVRKSALSHRSHDHHHPTEADSER